jgi:hypothetical protein
MDTLQHCERLAVQTLHQVCAAQDDARTHDRYELAQSAALAYERGVQLLTRLCDEWFDGQPPRRNKRGEVVGYTVYGEDGLPVERQAA